MKTDKAIALTELREFVEADQTTTFEKGVVKNVLILGADSRNKRKYTPASMRNAVSLYENAAVYTDHPVDKDKQRKGRAAEDRFGVLRDVNFVEQNGGQLRGDLHYLESHPMAPRLAEDWARRLNFFGLSHVANGTGIYGTDGITLVESIDKVLEVDLVTNPATATSLREQEEMPAPTPAVSPSEAGRQAEDLARATAEADEHADVALMNGVLAILKNPDLAIAEKAAKIQELFQAHLSVHEAAEDAAGTQEVHEQVTALKEQVNSLVKTNAELVKEFTAFKNRKYLPNGQPVQIPLVEQVQTPNSDVYPENGKAEDKAAWLRRRS